MAEERGFAVRSLGEIAIRCRDMEAMEAFYRDTIGLEVFAHRPTADDKRIIFFKISEGFGGHTTVLALFRAEDGEPNTGEGSSLHHIALSVRWAEQNAAMDWLRSKGLPVRVEHFDWVGWRGVFTEDPDGNTVELVAARPEPSATT